MCLPQTFDYLTPKEKLMAFEEIREHHALLQSAVFTERRERMQSGEVTALMAANVGWLKLSNRAQHPAEFAWEDHAEEHRQAKQRRLEIRRLEVVNGNLVGVTK